ncbi:MAG: cold shock domain-containing protein [Anaerolineales bacterium]|nr:cold shock domain-containing protein [Anaerolineales bacterium]
MADRLHGVVRWFNSLKGYGFIGCEDGEDVFVHYSALEMEGYKKLKEGQSVEFELESNPRGRQAAKVVIR